MAALDTSRARIQHLLRRAGFGYRAAELEEYVALGLAGTVERLLDPDLARWFELSRDGRRLAR